MLKKRYPGLEIVALVPDGSRALMDYIAFFQQVKYRPELKKGILKVNL